MKPKKNRDVSEVAKATCPRCGAEGILEIFNVNNRQYLRVIHYYYDTKGKRRKKRCYIGPLEDYEHVNRLHELGVTNLKDFNPAKIVMNTVENFIKLVYRNTANSYTSYKDIHEIAEKAKTLLTTLEICRKQIEKLISSLET